MENNKPDHRAMSKHHVPDFFQDPLSPLTKKQSLIIPESQVDFDFGSNDLNNLISRPDELDKLTDLSLWATEAESNFQSSDIMPHSPSSMDSSHISHDDEDLKKTSMLNFIHG